jgi:protein-tyrosine phosphatase
VFGPRSAAASIADLSTPGVHQTLLFLCSGNYYRSRFAEHLFNELASRGALPWRAESRGFRLWAGNIGPMSVEALTELRRLDIAVASPRLPMVVSAADLLRAHRVIAVKEAEHRAMLRGLFPEWEDRVEYWTIHDRDVATPEETLAALRDHVRDLVARLQS